jgi:sterol desaturase/sphingolipid hydroxylase (fatty acid hydroxylase superfamily)
MAKNFISNKKETVRMFNNDLLEKLSRVHPSIPVIIYLPLILFFLYNSFIVYKISFSKIFVLFIFGFFIWTVTEYLLHRFIFHFEAKSEIGKKLHFIIHGVHHDYPNDPKRLVMPPSVSIPLAIIFILLFKSIIGKISVYPFYAGFVSGYLFYDMTHYAVHHFNMHSKFWLAIKNHHMRHHYLDSTKGFGVSTPLWDILIGTNFKMSKQK